MTMPLPDTSVAETNSLNIALEAGLDMSVRLFPEDIRVAAQNAIDARSAMPDLADTTIEPWPTMFVERPI
jgi:hypothetical protein